MELPILQKLKDGEKFDFDTLACNYEQTEEFWEWWWSEKVGKEGISRPEMISDDDPVLVETIHKQTVDFTSYAEFFDRSLARAIQTNWLPAVAGCPRESFREKVKRLLHGCSAKLPGQPKLIFAGGGYGSGKTTTLNKLASAHLLAVEMRHMVGVDIFKSFVPEYQLIKGVGDGRASLTVQKECQEMASELFEDLVASGRSFIWDSSMSDYEQTLERIRNAQKQGYGLSMIAVLTPLEVAIRQAMSRAKTTRRFPNPRALPMSHQGFRQAFHDYVPYFDEVRVFANLGSQPGTENATCYEVALKEEGENELAILDNDMFLHALSSPKISHT